MADADKIAQWQGAAAERRQPGEIEKHLAGVTRVILGGPMDIQFGPLWDAAKQSRAFKQDFAEAHFKYTDGHGRVHVIKGAEVGEELFRDITLKHTQLYVLNILLKQLLDQFHQQYAATRKLGADGAVQVEMGFLPPQFQLYIESFLHSMKATLELYAIFTQFMFPLTTQGLPEVMDDQIKFFCKDSGKKLDPGYAKYLSEKMTWFIRFKDLRDSVSHFGSILLQAEEANGKINLSFYPRRSHILENRVPYSEIEQWIVGFADFCVFYRTHFLGKLKNSESNHSLDRPAAR